MTSIRDVIALVNIFMTTSISLKCFNVDFARVTLNVLTKFLVSIIYLNVVSRKILCFNY